MARSVGPWSTKRALYLVGNDWMYYHEAVSRVRVEYGDGEIVWDNVTVMQEPDQPRYALAKVLPPMEVQDVETGR
jgi:hypothetical protein